jgi:hypothetical protein
VRVEVLVIDAVQKPLCFANTRFSDLWISKHKALSKFVKESVAEDPSVEAGSRTEGPGIPDVARALLAMTPH